jgi:hypothetical protein
MSNFCQESRQSASRTAWCRCSKYRFWHCICSPCSFRDSCMPAIQHYRTVEVSLSRSKIRRNRSLRSLRRWMWEKCWLFLNLYVWLTCPQSQGTRQWCLLPGVALKDQIAFPVSWHVIVDLLLRKTPSWCIRYSWSWVSRQFWGHAGGWVLWGHWSNYWVDIFRLLIESCWVRAPWWRWFTGWASCAPWRPWNW